MPVGRRGDRMLRRPRGQGMASWDIAGAGDRKLLVAVYHPLPDRADALTAAIDSAGLAVQLLPQHVDGLRAWVDSCFDLLLVNPFLDWPEPFEFVRLARSIAGRRPLLVVSDRDSLGDRMTALSAGADDAVGWPNKDRKSVVGGKRGTVR